MQDMIKRSDKAQSFKMKIVIVLGIITALLFFGFIIFRERGNTFRLSTNKAQYPENTNEIYHVSDFSDVKAITISDFYAMNGGESSADKSDMKLTGIVRLGKNDAEIRYDMGSMAVIEISGDFQTGDILSAKDAFRGFMSVKDLFKVNDKAAYALQDSKTRQDGYSEYRYIRKIGLADVDGSSLKIGSDPDGNLAYISGKYDTDLSEDFNTEPSITQSEIIKDNDLSMKPEDLILTIVKNDGEYLLTWRGQTKKHVISYYSAENGELLYERTTMIE